MNAPAIFPADQIHAGVVRMARQGEPRARDLLCGRRKRGPLAQQMGIIYLIAH